MNRNIYLLYNFKFFRDFLLIAPVIIPFYKENNLTAFQILLVQAVFSASLLLFEIPSGYFSDRCGRKRTLIAGGIAVCVGLLIYCFSSSLIMFMICEIFLGFGFSMCSGTESALLYDTLHADGKASDYRKKESHAEFFARLGAALSSVAGGFIASVSLRLPFFFNAASAVMIPLSAAFMRDVKTAEVRRSGVMKEIINAVLFSIRHPVILSAGFVSGAVLTCGIISIWGYFLILPDLEIPLSAYGLLFFFFQISSALGARFSHSISAFIGKKKTLALLLLIPVIYVSVAFFKYAVILAFLQSFLWGVATPFFLDIINSKAESRIRATVLSTVSMGSRVLYVAVGPVFGLVVDAFGAPKGFLFLSGIFILCASAGLFIYLRGRKKD
jgi:MFS family permease